MTETAEKTRSCAEPDCREIVTAARMFCDEHWWKLPHRVKVKLFETQGTGQWVKWRKEALAVLRELRQREHLAPPKKKP